jgi:uncharacterized protein YdhG (YjbR/CyaY superfamily)
MQKKQQHDKNMPNYYDIYVLSENRDKKTVEKFLNQFCFRDKIENIEEQEIAVYKNKKYNIEETWVKIKTISEVISFGLKESNHGFVFYISNNLKEDISHIILKFTFDGKIIFGASIKEYRIDEKGELVDNYDKALNVERLIFELTSAKKTSIQFENAPSDDEEEFDKEIEVWKSMNESKKIMSLKS